MLSVNATHLSQEKKMEDTLVFMPEKSHGQRSLVGYSPWGHKESDVTELLNNSNSPL